jgi:hypothetical protein
VSKADLDAQEGVASPPLRVVLSVGLAATQSHSKERVNPMASNLPKKNNRTNELDALQKLAEGFAKHAAAIPQIVVAGASMTQSEVIAKLQARIAIAKTVQTTHATWQTAVKTDKEAVPQYKAFLAGVRQTVQAAFGGQIDALADFGMSQRKVPVVTPETRAAAALKAKATRALRGTKSKKQKAKVKASVTVTPATATVNAPAALAPSASSVPADHTTPVTASPAPVVSPPAPATPATPAAPATPTTHS